MMMENIDALRSIVTLELPRIALVATHGYVAAEPPLGAADTGGQVVYVLELAKRLAKLGHRVDIWTRRFEVCSALGIVFRLCLALLLVASDVGANGLPRPTNWPATAEAVVDGRMLLALTVIDDLGAILVIALFYSAGIQVSGLFVAVGGLIAIVGMQRFGVRNKLV